jgi:hypothetical protein
MMRGGTQTGSAQGRAAGGVREGKDTAMTRFDRLLLGLLMTCVPMLAPAQGAGPAVDRGATVRKAQEALRADGSHPGDETLSCEAIGEEMAGLFGQMDPELSTLFSAAQRANEETNRTQQVLAARTATEGPALMARAVAEGMLAGTNPAAAAALSRAGIVQDQLAVARAATDGQRANSAMQATAAASAGLIDQHSDKIPRMNRLTQLFEAKQCKPPPGSETDDDD